MRFQNLNISVCLLTSVFNQPVSPSRAWVSLSVCPRSTSNPSVAPYCRYPFFEIPKHLSNRSKWVLLHLNDIIYYKFWKFVLVYLLNLMLTKLKCCICYFSRFFLKWITFVLSLLIFILHFWHHSFVKSRNICSFISSWASITMSLANNRIQFCFHFLCQYLYLVASFHLLSN